ncbi:MAG: hypothetical protein KF809_14110 [Chloroflexi bacterium]|nr:hypothetical protein [Chloroflexota bacterium]
MIVRIMLLVALVASAAVVVYGLLFDRTGQAIPFTVAGLLVLGVTSGVVSVGLATMAIGAGQEGRAIRALGGTFIGGLFALGAAASLLGAVILGYIELAA